LLTKALPPGRGAYLFLTHPLDALHSIQMPSEPESYAAQLYATLHELDPLALDYIAVEPPPNTPEWRAIWDRLTRAAVK
jgi:L-threonylcarbamoyladenylate synthase